MSSSLEGFLLVEDNPDDEALTCLVLRQAAPEQAIAVVRNGAEALDYLFAGGKYEGRELADQPTVVILDLNIPKISGLDVLKAIRSDQRTATLPVVVFSSSRQQEDLRSAYQLGINSYVAKPVEFEEFKRQVTHIATYWSDINQTPDQH